MLGKFLEHTWAHLDPDAACDMLASPDVDVTNRKDKEEQIAKIREKFGTRQTRTVSRRSSARASVVSPTTAAFHVQASQLD